MDTQIENNISKLSSQIEIQNDNFVALNTTIKPSNRSENKSIKTEMGTEETLQHSFKSNITTFGGDLTDGFMDFNDSNFYLSEASSYKSKDEIQQKSALSIDAFGIGANRNVNQFNTLYTF